MDIFVIVGNVIAMTIGALTDKNKDDINAKNKFMFSCN